MTVFGIERAAGQPLATAIRRLIQPVRLWIPVALTVILCATFLIRDHAVLRHLFLGVVVLPFVLTTTAAELRGLLRSPVVATTVVYLGYFWLSVFWSALPERAPDLGADAGSLLAFMVIVVALQQRDPRFAGRLIRALVVTAGVAAPIALVWFYAHHDFPGERAHGIGLGGYPTRAAMLYSIAVLAGLFAWLIPARTPSERALAALALAGPILLILLAQARGVMVGVTVAIVAGALVLGGRRALVVVLAPLVLIALASVTGLIDPGELLARGFTLRLQVWDLALERATTAPWIGHGLGEPQNFLLWGSMLIVHPHNMILAHQLAGGLLGTALFVAILALALVAAGRHAVREREPLVLLLLISVSTCGLVEFDLFLQPLDIEWLYFWLPIALAAGCERHRSSSCVSSRSI